MSFKLYLSVAWKAWLQWFASKYSMDILQLCVFDVRKLLQRRNAAVTSLARAETGKASIGTREATRQNCCTSGISVSRWRRADSCFQFTEMPVWCSSISFYQHKFYRPHSRHYMPLHYCLYGLFLVEDKKGAQCVL